MPICEESTIKNLKKNYIYKGDFQLRLVCIFKHILVIDYVRKVCADWGIKQATVRANWQRKHLKGLIHIHVYKKEEKEGDTN